MPAPTLKFIVAKFTPSFFIESSSMRHCHYFIINFLAYSIIQKVKSILAAILVDIDLKLKVI